MVFGETAPAQNFYLMAIVNRLTNMLKNKPWSHSQG